MKISKATSLGVGRKGLAEPGSTGDDRDVAETVQALGKKMERATAPRNSLDLLALTTDPNPTGVRSMGPPVPESTDSDGRDTSSPKSSSGLELISLISSMKRRLADRMSAAPKPVENSPSDTSLAGPVILQPVMSVIETFQP
jgi:hypothetical protein